MRFVNPGDLRAAPLGLRPVPPRARCGASRKSMMTHGAMLCGAALYNNGVAARRRTRSSARATGPTASRACCRRCPPRPPRRRATRASCRPSIRFPRWELGAARQPVPRVRARRPAPARGRHSRSVEDAGPARQGPARRAASARSTAPTRSSSGCRRRACSTRCCRSSAPTTSPATTARAAARRATSSTPTTARRRNSGPYADVRQPRPDRRPRTRRSRRTSRAIPLSHVFTRSIPSSQCMTCHMHPGTNMVDHLPRLHVVGQRDRRRAMYPEDERKLIAPHEQDAIAARATRRARRSRGLWSDREFLEPDARRSTRRLKKTQFADFHGHGWVFRAVYKQRPQGQPARRATARPVRARRPRQASRRRCT